MATKSASKILTFLSSALDATKNTVPFTGQHTALLNRCLFSINSAAIVTLHFILQFSSTAAARRKSFTAGVLRATAPVVTAISSSSEVTEPLQEVVAAAPGWGFWQWSAAAALTGTAIALVFLFPGAAGAGAGGKGILLTKGAIAATSATTTVAATTVATTNTALVATTSAPGILASVSTAISSSASSTWLFVAGLLFTPTTALVGQTVAIAVGTLYFEDGGGPTLPSLPPEVHAPLSSILQSFLESLVQNNAPAWRQQHLDLLTSSLQGLTGSQRAVLESLITGMQHNTNALQTIILDNQKIMQVRMGSSEARLAFTTHVQSVLKSVEYAISYDTKFVQDFTKLHEFPNFEGKDFIIQRVNNRGTMENLQTRRQMLLYVLSTVNR